MIWMKSTTNSPVNIHNFLKLIDIANVKILTWVLYKPSNYQMGKYTFERSRRKKKRKFWVADWTGEQREVFKLILGLGERESIVSKP